MLRQARKSGIIKQARCAETGEMQAGCKYLVLPSKMLLCILLACLLTVSSDSSFTKPEQW